jgi:hypothetical protein
VIVIRKIETPEDLLAWLKERPVHAFDAESADRRVMSGTKGRRTETIEVGTDLFRQLDGMLVWAHEDSGADLAGSALFKLRPPVAN